MDMRGRFVTAIDPDRSGIEALEGRWQDAWNRHSARDLGALFTEDVDFVTVGGTWLKGRTDFERYHAEKLRTQFKDSRFRVNQVHIGRLRPDLALVHVEWRLEGDRDPDGKPRQPREGIFTQIIVKDGDSWKIRASHNTNKLTTQPSSQPLAEGH